MSDGRGKLAQGVRNNGKTWSFVLDFGRVPAQRCQACDHREWVTRHKVAACPACGATDLIDTQERRQEQHGGYATRTAATRARTKALNELNSGVRVARDDTTLGEYLEKEWLPSLQGGVLRESTLAGYRSHVEHHLAPTALGMTKLRELTRQRIQTHFAELREHGRADGADKPLSAASIHRIAATLHRALRDAVRDNVLPFNPADDVELPQVPKPQLTFWDSTQVATFLTSVRNDRLGPLWLLYGATGARRGELLGLRWDCVGIDHDEAGEVTGGRIAIRRTLLQIRGVVTEGVPKTASSVRTIELDPACARALERLRGRQDVERALAGDDWHGDESVFASEDGAPVEPDGVSHAFTAAVKASGLPRLRLHDMRHSFATIALNELHEPITQVSARLGHRDPSVTMSIYSHAIHKQDAALANDVGSAIIPEGW